MQHALKKVSDKQPLRYKWTTEILIDTPIPPQKQEHICKERYKRNTVFLSQG